jgi:hypothetical protein
VTARSDDESPRPGWHFHCRGYCELLIVATLEIRSQREELDILARSLAETTDSRDALIVTRDALLVDRDQLTADQASARSDAAAAEDQIAALQAQLSDAKTTEAQLSATACPRGHQ